MTKTMKLTKEQEVTYRKNYRKAASYYNLQKGYVHLFDEDMKNGYESICPLDNLSEHRIKKV